MGIAAEDIEYSKASLLPTMKHQVRRKLSFQVASLYPCGDSLIGFGR